MEHIIKSQLFISFCSSFYGIQICDLTRTEKIQTAWRKLLRDVWQLPYRTHSRLLPSLSNSMCCKHMMVKWFIKFACNGLQHNSPEIRYMFNTAVTLQNTSFAKSLRLAGKETQLVPESFSDQSVYFCVRQIMKECEQQCKMLDDCRTSHTISELSKFEGWTVWFNSY